MALDVTGGETGQRPDSGHCSFHLEKIEALRDFFDAADSREIQQSFTRLSRCFRKGCCREKPGNEKRDPDIPWLEIEFQFNRLFV